MEIKSYDNPKITIFMPVYNGAKYLNESIESLLKQTYPNFELLCVDDTSTDNSFSILQKYAELDKRVVVFIKPHGGKYAMDSWNFILPKIKGRYVTYMSQDDIMSLDNLQLCIERAEETDADIVVPDMIYYYQGKKKNRIISGIKGDRSKIISGKEAFILSLRWKVHGFNMCKSEMMAGDLFDESIFNDDEYLTRKRFLFSNKVAFCSGKFYYRQDNPQAITKVFKPHTITSLLTDEKIIKLMYSNHIKKVHILRYTLKSIVKMLIFYIKFEFNKSNYDDNTIDKSKKIFNSHLRNLKKPKKQK